MKYKIVCVKWVDSSLQGEWVIAPGDSTGISSIESVGYLIYDGKKHIEIAQNIAPIHKSSIMSIPKSVIKKMYELKVKK